MGRHVNTSTGVVFSVDDGKDDRYAAAPFEAHTGDQDKPKRGPGRPRKSE